MKFPANFEVFYSQDFAFCKGTFPEDLEFTVEELGYGKVCLRAPGYGGNPYGNGAIYMLKKYLPPTQDWLLA